MERYSDDELIYLMRCGSQIASDYLYRRCYRYISKWVLPYSKRRSFGYDYEDYVQMAMMYVPEILDSYRDDFKASLKTYMKQAVLRRLLTIVSRKDYQSLHQQVFIQLDNWLGIDQTMRYSDVTEDPYKRHYPEIELHVKETQTYYQTQIEAHASPREIEVMTYIQEGYNQEEIAKILHIPIKSVYNAIYRYHKKLQAIDVAE
ncbi:MAG: RNA polymerase sigma factor [Longibaculum sp.]